MPNEACYSQTSRRSTLKAPRTVYSVVLSSHCRPSEIVFGQGGLQPVMVLDVVRHVLRQAGDKADIVCHIHISGCCSLRGVSSDDFMETLRDFPGAYLCLSEYFRLLRTCTRSNLIFWPWRRWPKARAKGNAHRRPYGLRPWPEAMAKGHGERPWRKAMTKGSGQTPP